MNHAYILSFLLLIQSLAFSQARIFGVINGDKPLSNVNINIPELNVSTTSDADGYFEFDNVTGEKLTVVFSYIGYKTRSEEIEIGNNVSYEMNIYMDEKVIKLGEAVVISSKFDHLLKETPLPIELVSEKKLNSSSGISASDVIKRESGVSIIKDGPWASTINIRGLSKQNLVYLIDGNRIETSTNIAAGLSLMDINDFQNIEIVKGGLSSLYGTGATGGVVNIQSKTAEFSRLPYLSSQVISSYNSVNNGYSNYLNLKSGGENWSIKLNGSMRKADDTNIPDGKLENSSFRDESHAASLKYSPLENVTVNMDYQKFSAYDVGIPGGEPFPPTATADYKYAKRELFSPSIEYSNISKYLIKTKLKYYHQLISRSVELRPNQFVDANPKADHTTNGLSFQSDWLLDRNNLFIFGIDYWQREYNGTRKVVNNAQNVISVDKPIPNSTFSSFGFFAQDNINFSDDLNLTLSARYDFINIENDETKNPQYRIINGTRNENIRNDLASFVAYDENNKSISGGAGAVYKLFNDLDAVLNVAYNFRSPSLEERYQYIDLGGIVYLGNPELKPEEGVFLDAGFRIWKENVNFRVNGFLNSFSNLVLDDVLFPDSIFIKNNIGKSRLYGLDTRLDYNFYKQYIFYALAAYVQGEDLSKDEDLPQIPPFNGIIGLVIPIAYLFEADMSVTFASDQNRTASGESRTGGYSYYDLSISSRSFELGFIKLKFLAGVQNIFNKKYTEHLSTYRGIKRFEPGRNIFAKLIIDIK